MENTTKHKFRIIKRVHSRKVVKLLVQQVKYPHRVFLEVREESPVAIGYHKTPEWLKEFVDKLNREEIKFVK
jgi:alpha-glucuronidase